MFEDPTAPLKLAIFADDAQALDEHRFAERHGPAFLLHYGPLEGLREPARVQRTVASDAGPGAFDVRALQASFLVFPVRVTGRSPFPNFVSVGRSPKNDVVIPDVSLSSFHAFFQQDDAGAMRLQDAGSKNGSFVNDHAVPKKTETTGISVSAGDRVRFGTIDLVYLPASQFQAMAKRLAQ